MFPFIFAALVFVTLSNLYLIVIPNFSLMGCERSHHAKRCHTPRPVINLKRRRDIGFPAHGWGGGINGLVFDSVKSKISLTRLESLDHLS